MNQEGLISEYGFVGNVWVRMTRLELAGDYAGGHAHYHDHVTMLVKGSVRVVVDDCEPKDFTAPTFIVIKKEHRHNFTALEDDTVYYCVFALRDIDGEVIDIYSSENLPNLPYSFPEYTNTAPDDFWHMQD